MPSIPKNQIKDLVLGDHDAAVSWIGEQIATANRTKDSDLKKDALNNIANFIGTYNANHNLDKTLKFALYALDNLDSPSEKIYKHAIQVCQTIQNNAAIELICNRALDNNLPNSAYIISAKVSALIAQEKFEDAVDFAQEHALKHPEIDILQIKYANALIASVQLASDGRITEAKTILAPLVKKENFKLNPNTVRLAALEIACMDDSEIVSDTFNPDGKLVRAFKRFNKPKEKITILVKSLFKNLHPERAARIQAELGDQTLEDHIAAALEL